MLGSADRWWHRSAAVYECTPARKGPGPGKRSKLAAAMRVVYYFWDSRLDYQSTKRRCGAARSFRLTKHAEWFFRSATGRHGRASDAVSSTSSHLRIVNLPSHVGNRSTSPRGWPSGVWALLVPPVVPSCSVTTRDIVSPAHAVQLQQSLSIGSSPLRLGPVQEFDLRLFRQRPPRHSTWCQAPRTARICSIAA
jgi:hypothetical protein